VCGMVMLMREAPGFGLAVVKERGEKKRDKTGRIEVGLADDRVKKDG
jgi:hypothetical protein